jgi:hypothetical protein
MFLCTKNGKRLLALERREKFCAQTHPQRHSQCYEKTWFMIPLYHNPDSLTIFKMNHGSNF